jgi:DNA-binding NarL/FixJ family response regulator
MTGNSTIHLILLDHHTMVREGIHMLLGTHPLFQITGETGQSSVAVEMARSLAPDIILLELNLDGELNTEIIPELVKAAPHSRLILLTGIDDRSIHRLAVQMGAMGVVSKSEGRDVLFKAIEKVHAGEVWIDRIMMASVLNSISRPRDHSPEAARIASLSEREKEVILLIGRGMKNKEIAKCLTISETTVRHHLSSIYEKLDVADRLELSIYAYRNGLAELPT